MATGRSNKLVGQTGEYLVAAELSRMGLIATTFTGNVPHYDIIAADERGKHVFIQVKAGKANSWQLDIRQFCEIGFDGEKQVVGSKKKCPVIGLVMVFVRVCEDRSDRYYVCRWEDLRDLLVKGHKEFLARHGGRRPKKWDSMHSAILESVLEPFLEKWDVVTEGLR
ncbi:MAG: hypothetical protein J0M04_16540 [Verrucomicrobia bacterium]|nr:hypothetical protein [Verrucomicrobiota bacterium]